MNSFLDRIRSGAGKAAFEADKLRRLNAVQSEIKGLKDEVRRGLNRVGDIAYDLYRDGQIDQPALQEACRQVQALHEQIVAYEAELENIRQEEYVEESPASQYGHICPRGHGPIPPENNFCQECGARAVEVPPPATANRFCQNCGQQLGPEARFCANCGTPAPQPKAEPAPVFCQECGTTLLPDAVFCSECGVPVLAGEPDETPGSEVQTVPAAEAGNSELPREAEREAAATVEEAIEDADATRSQVANCPSCNMPLLPEALFCAECGHQLEGA